MGNATVQAASAGSADDELIALAKADLHVHLVGSPRRPSSDNC